MAESFVRGHKIHWNGENWFYSDGSIVENSVNWDDVPEEWADRCSGDGNKRYVDENGDRRYSEDNVLLEDGGCRPCKKCGKFPNERGDDACIANLGKVLNACCGHGVNEGYIQFDNGITIRGYFTVEKN